MKKLFRNIPLIKYFLDIRKELALTRFQVTQQTRIQQQIYRQILLSARLKEGRDFPIRYEHQTFSQNGEDGILQEILRRLDIKTGWFVEIGSGDGCENNTRLLLELGWKGVWIDGNKDCCEYAIRENSKFVKNQNVQVVHSLITAENINDVLRDSTAPEKIEVLSLDVDLNTYHVWEKLEVCQALVAIVEYNGFFPADSDWIAEYDPNGWWQGDFRMGAALKSMTLLAHQKGYRLVGCDLSGANAFFVRHDLAEKHFPNENDPLGKFEPAQPFLLNNPEHRQISQPL